MKSTIAIYMFIAINNEWINKMWCRHTMEYPALKRKEILTQATKQMNFEDINAK